ncbi:MAG: type IV toxin-antitoxin system AbiEi family antitoxin [Burkholderiales bacterium]|nr:type IV toxin-antitoxin system AbiEi family antitoxin [Burkholderiales bacterium]
MLKHSDAMKSLEGDAAQALKGLLEQVPVVKVVGIEQESAGSDHRKVDIVAHVEVSGQRHLLVCEVKSSGQPRHVRMAVLQLRNFLAHQEQQATPVFIAPYLSPEAQALCREESVGYLDLEGNARLLFDSVFIERTVASKPAAERREFKSLFKPKSAQVLRVMLVDPGKAWRVTELAKSAEVSLGHVSNVRTGLLDREWAKVSAEGLFLSDPDALLDAWREAYEPPAGKRISFYTTLHGGAFEEAARRVLGSASSTRHAAFASFSAAHWLAPFARTGTQYLYADEVGVDALRTGLSLTSASKGENVVVTVLKDPVLLQDTVESAPGAVCTSPLQTYLDLSVAGERGREAADHLRREKLTWLT